MQINEFPGTFTVASFHMRANLVVTRVCHLQCFLRFICLSSSKKLNRVNMLFLLIKIVILTAKGMPQYNSASFPNHPFMNCIWLMLNQDEVVIQWWHSVCARLTDSEVEKFETHDINVFVCIAY